MKWNAEREELENKIDSELNSDTIIDKMIESKDKWIEIENYIVKILKEKIQYENDLEKQKRQENKSKT